MSEDLMRSGNPFDIIFVIRNPGAISYSFLNWSEFIFSSGKN